MDKQTKERVLAYLRLNPGCKRRAIEKALSLPVQVVYDTLKELKEEDRVLEHPHALASTWEALP